MARVTKFRLELHCQGAAFDDAISAETARILRTLADSIESEFSGILPDEYKVRDINGNTCGAAAFYIGRVSK